MVDADVAELVDDDGGVGKVGRLQPGIEQCRLSAAQKASQHYHRKAIVDQRRYSSNALVPQHGVVRPRRSATLQNAGARCNSFSTPLTLIAAAPVYPPVVSSCNSHIRGEAANGNLRNGYREIDILTIYYYLKSMFLLREMN